MSAESFGSGQGAVDLSQMVSGVPTSTSDPGGYPPEALAGTYAGDPAELPASGSGPIVDAPLISDVTEANFDAHMALSQTIPVVLVLYSKNSLPSKQALSTLESVVRSSRGAFQLGKIDVEASPALAAAFQAPTLPAAFAIMARRPVPMFEGVPTEAQVTEILDELLQVAPQLGVTGRIRVSDEDLEQPIPEEHWVARAAEDEGDWSKAVKAWKKVLANNPSDQEAKTALARARFERRYEKELVAVEVGEGSPDSPATLADNMFARGDEEGAFNVLLDSLVATYDPKEKEAYRKQLVGLFPIATDSAAVKSARTRLATHLMV